MKEREYVKAIFEDKIEDYISAMERGEEGDLVIDVKKAIYQIYRKKTGATICSDQIISDWFKKEHRL